jgi:hypothetical protein
MAGTKKPRHKRRILAGTKSLAGRKVDETLKLLMNAGIPVGSLTAVGRDRIALALLSIANMKPGTPWSEAAIHGDGANWKLTSRQIINFQGNNILDAGSASGYCYRERGETTCLFRSLPASNRGGQ